MVLEEDHLGVGGEQLCVSGRKQHVWEESSRGCLEAVRVWGQQGNMDWRLAGGGKHFARWWDDVADGWEYIVEGGRTLQDLVLVDHGSVAFITMDKGKFPCGNYALQDSIQRAAIKSISTSQSINIPLHALPLCPAR